MVAALFVAPPLCAVAATTTSPTVELAVTTQPLAVAVVEFVTLGEPIEKDGEKIQALLTAYLTADSSLRLVERKEMEKILSEQKLSLSGLVDEQQAIQVGRLVGAKVMVMGRGFLVDDNYVIVGKTIGTETGRVFGDMVQGKRGDSLTNLVAGLAEKIGATVKKNRNVLTAPPKGEDNRIAAINKALGKLARPGALVSCAEQHIGRPVIDPAAETEVAYLLTACGFKVIEKKDWDSGPWLRDYLRDPKTPVPNEVKKPVDILVLGEAFSEFAARTGDLISCRARVELKAIDRQTGEVLAIGRETATAVDLAENIAAKKALQDAAARLAERIIPEATRKWNEMKRKSKD
jgi:hypothetical protein